MKNLFYKITIYLSRKDYSPNTIKKFQKKFIYIFLIYFFLTTFRFDFSSYMFLDGVLYANSFFLIFNLFILSMFTLFTIFYTDKWEQHRDKYLRKLLREHKEIVCSYKDNFLDNNVHEVKGSSLYRGIYYYHIHLTTGEIYRFDDYRSFKFVGVKESRRIKLKRLSEFK